MTDWVDIANSAVAPKAPVTSELMNALRDNTITTMWETVATVYDSAIDGTVASVTTPTFEDGWDYGITFNNILCAAGGTASFQVLLNLSGGTQIGLEAYNYSNTTGTPNLLSISPVTEYSGGLWVSACRWNRPINTAIIGYADLGLSRQTSAETNAGGGNLLASNTVGGKVDSFEIRATGTSAGFSSGTITLRRIRNQTYA